MKDAEKTEIENSSENLQDNGILLISQVKNKVFLPYTVQELREIFEKNSGKYQNIRELIESEYTVPLTKYKHPAISRFGETYKLMRQKMRSSFFDAVDLAFELMPKRYLHPAVIAACKNLDMLDIYLDCLECNESEQFPFFKIEYELIIKNKDKT